jgi:hypothetical protein
MNVSARTAESALLNDEPTARGEARLAKDAATKTAKDRIAQLPNEQAAPSPRSLDQIRADHAWAEQRSINWSKAVIRVVRIA